MTLAITFLAFAALLQAFTRLFKCEDRRWLSIVTLGAFVGLFSLLALANLWFPYGGAKGDDHDYFNLATAQLQNWTNVFDLTRFTASMEQPGYAWLLSILAQFTGTNLLALKLLNLAFYIALFPVWYRIGVELDSRRFGRTMVIGVLLLTPLWFYWMFLLKDIVIALLQSVFLLGAVKISRNRGREGWLLILLSSVAIIPFRAQLVLSNVAVVVGVVALISLRRGQRGEFFKTLFVSAVLIGSIMSLVTNPRLMAMLGISTQQRVVGSKAFLDSATSIGDISSMNRALFPILYLVTETGGMNVNTWIDFDSSGLRAVLAIPWIILGVPFFVGGLGWLFRSGLKTTPREGLIARIRASRVVATPWGCVLLFILCYMAISWNVGDTTRWRISDMPAMTAVAVAGWLSTKQSKRIRVLFLWSVLVGGSIAVFNLIRVL